LLTFVGLNVKISVVCRFCYGYFWLTWFFHLSCHFLREKREFRFSNTENKLILKLTTATVSKLRKRYVDVGVSLVIASFVILGYRASDPYLNAPKTPRQNKAAQYLFGFNLDSFYIEKDHVIKKNEVFGSILSDNGLDQNVLLLLEHEARDIFNIRNIGAGDRYHIIKKGECDPRPQAIVYEPDRTQYVIYDFRDSVSVRLVERKVNLVTEESYGDKNVNPSIIDLMEDALSSSVDFHHTQKGDKFKLIYENKYLDGKQVGMGRLIAACYINDNGANYSFLYKPSKDDEGYFDQDGRPAKKAFLKAPVKFSRISSNFNLRRFHPIKGRTIPHLGTDYAAPYGTEIHSVSDGTIMAAHYAGGNGNFVKVKHDNVYETQYLHMSRFAKGIRPGARVKQGQTIGYVGSTGLSTGPHVCFRFWKNGRQVNHLREKLPTAQPMNMTELPAFFMHRDEMILKLDKIDAAIPATTNAANAKP
jgi:murein DD-endopeptidase MepM/ murein hydrolase activator NlpD